MLDARGLEVTGADAATISALDRFAADFLGFRDEAAAILEIAAAAPHCALAQVYAAAFFCYSQSAALIAANAAPLIARAAEGRDRCTERERLLIDAIRAWTESAFEDGVSHIEALVARWPHDVVATKFAEFMLFQAPDFPRHLALMEKAAAANRDCPAFKAMHAFACELNRRDGPAEALAQEAIEMDPDTPWAHHALAHLYLNQGEVERGIDVLALHAPRWAANSRGIRAHNFWHLALLHLARREAAPVHRLYFAEIAGFEPQSAFEHTDAISLQWRLELADLPVAQDWRAVAAVAAERAADPVFPFLNAHYVYALGRAGDGAAARSSIGSLARYAESAQGARRRVWRVGIPLLEGCLALAEGDHTRAAERLEPVMGEIGCVGGSDAQNELFRSSCVAALLGAGRRHEARAMLQSGRAGRRMTPLDEHWLARAS